MRHLWGRVRWDHIRGWRAPGVSGLRNGRKDLPGREGKGMLAGAAGCGRYPESTGQRGSWRSGRKEWTVKILPEVSPLGICSLS